MGPPSSLVNKIKHKRKITMYIKKFLGSSNAARAARSTGKSLNEAYQDFLNPFACQQANPYSNTFWTELKCWLKSISQKAEEYPKTANYREQLAPYCLHQVHLVAESWHVAEVFDETVRLCLEDVRLAHVRGRSVGCAPNVFMDHMNLMVSSSWFNRVAPSPNEGICVNGILYEYVNSGNERNIGIMGVAVMPRNRKTAAAKPLSGSVEEYAA